MPKPPRPVAAAIKKPPQRFEPEKHSCCMCGGMAPFGLGPPLQDPLRWYCHAHWLWQPSTVAHFAAQLREIMREGDL